MKNPWFTIPAASLLGAAVLFTGCSQQTPETTPQKPMNPAVSQLDLDGDFILFLNTSTVEERVTDQMDLLVSMVKTHADPTEAQQVDTIAKQVKSAVEWSGLLSIDSFSMSMKTVEGNLSRVITIAEYSKEDSTKALWRILAADPKVLKGIQYAPADAVYAANSTASLNELWKVANEALEEFFPPEANQEVAQQIAMVEALLGTGMSDLFGSLGTECLISIQLSETKQCTIPIAGETLTIPEPSLIIGLQTKDPLVGTLILAKLAEAKAPVAASQHGGHTLHTLNLPIPMPFPVKPTLVQTEDYLLIASSLEAITKALDSQASKNGLIATSLYKKLLADAPEKTSGIEFLSPRFMQTYINGIKQAMAATAGAAELSLIEQMIGGYEQIEAGSYLLKTPTGLYSYSLGDYGSVNPGELIASAGAGYVGLMAAIAIPLMTGNQDRATSTEAQAGCSSVYTAMRIHLVEHGNFDGVKGISNLEMIKPRDLDGTYFKDASYSIKVVDDQNYSITARGVGKATGRKVVLNIKNGQQSWDIE